MELLAIQEWFKEFAQKEGWLEHNGIVNIGFLLEEAGEVAREVRRHEVGRHIHNKDEVMTKEEMRLKLAEEIGDVLQVLSVIATKYDISLEEAFIEHKNKITREYGEE